MTLSIILLTCAGILSSHPGCREHVLPMRDVSLPMNCAARAQDLIHLTASLHPGELVARYGCKRQEVRP